jgi:hypothetical protein
MFEIKGEEYAAILMFPEGRKTVGDRFLDQSGRQNCGKRRAAARLDFCRRVFSETSHL